MKRIRILDCVFLMFLVFSLGLFRDSFAGTEEDSCGANKNCVKISTKNIEFRYRALGEEPFFNEEVSKFTRESAGVYSTSKSIELKAGERMIDHFFGLTSLESDWAGEMSFLFYRDNRGLASLVSEVTSSEAAFDEAGRLSKLVIKGTDLDGDKITITRTGFKYDTNGRIRSYGVTHFYPDGGLSGSQTSLGISEITYRKEGRIKQFVYSYQGYGGSDDKKKVYNIKYNMYGDVISCFRNDVVY